MLMNTDMGGKREGRVKKDSHLLRWFLLFTLGR